ncbi:MAG: arylsulfatase, partial [Planctomycetes bacterium]|nr:arylsulfatase [Planctomycetota bacterium]
MQDNSLRLIVQSFIFILCAAISTQAAQPNIVLFVADDFGRGSINALGAPEKYVRTPHLNNLVENGIHFTKGFTTASVCTPTRYAMLTGQYSWRSRLKSGVVNNSDPLLISTETETLGKFLQKQGYQTAAVGKWHLGYKDHKFKDLLGVIKPGPNEVGFDYHFGVPNNLDDLHKVYIENDHIYELRSDKIKAWGESFYGGKPYKGYDATQRVCEEVMAFTTQKALDWMAKVPKEQPLFMYYAAAAVHHPITPSAQNKGESGAGLYGDFIHDVDDSVGQFIEHLRKIGRLDNTLFIFTSDNGGDIPKRKDWPEYKAYEMGFHFNGANRGDKHSIYEGGLKVPMIVHWPRAIKNAASSDALVTTADFFSTISEIITGELPDPLKVAPDSFSFYNVLKEPKSRSHRSYLVHRDAPGRKAIRRGKWKLIDN